MSRPAALALSLLAFLPFALALALWTDLPAWQYLALCALIAQQAGNYTAIGRVGDTEVSVWTSVSHAEAQLTFADGAR
jgi:hypothetical protein